MSQFRAAFKRAYGERRWYGQITGMKLTQITTKRPYRTLEITMTKREIAMWARSARRFSPTARNIGLRDGINAVHVIRSDAMRPLCRASSV
jgi:hypothetical protein